MTSIQYVNCNKDRNLNHFFVDVGLFSKTLCYRELARMHFIFISYLMQKKERGQEILETLSGLHNKSQVFVLTLCKLSEQIQRKCV